MSKKGLWINLGSSGRVFPNFENIDREPIQGVRVVDVRLGLPYADASAELICASHVLEHLHPFKELPAVLAECKRVLIPGGVFRIAVPDLDLLADSYANRTMEKFAKTQGELSAYLGVAYEALPPALQFSVIAFGNNSGSMAYDGHFAAWDFDSLKWALERAGFSNVEAVGFDDVPFSRLPWLADVYKDADAPEQIVVEASKP